MGLGLRASGTGAQLKAIFRSLHADKRGRERDAAEETGRAMEEGGGRWEERGGCSLFPPPSLPQGPFRHEFLRPSRRRRGAHIQSGRRKNWPFLPSHPAFSLVRSPLGLFGVSRVSVGHRHPFSKAWQYHSQTVIQPCMWFTEEPAGQFLNGQTAQSLTRSSWRNHMQGWMTV